jgi:hypothetical protein
VRTLGINATDSAGVRQISPGARKMHLELCSKKYKLIFIHEAPDIGFGSFFVLSSLTLRISNYFNGYMVMQR